MNNCYSLVRLFAGIYNKQLFKNGGFHEDKPETEI